MKVFQINIVLNGSTGKIARGIYEISKQNGIESRIAYSRGPKMDNSDFIKFGSKIGVYTHGILSRIFDTVGLHSRFATRQLIGEIEKFQPDIIHLQNIHGYYLNYKMLFRYIKAKNIKTLYTLHDCWTFTGHCAHFDMAGCDKWKTGCYKCPNKHTYPKSILLDNSKRNYKIKKALFSDMENLTLATPSNWLAELVKQSFLKNADVKVIHNGIDLNLFKPTLTDFIAEHNLEHKKIVLGVAGVWNHRKGLADFMELRKLLSEDYQIVLVGLSKKQIAALPQGILGITRTESAEELAGIYTSAHVFVNPTYEDNFPTVNLEALACGTPVITYKTGGSPESLSENCGCVVERGDIGALAKLIKSHDFDNLNIKENCSLRSQDFNQENKFRNYVELYNLLMAQGEEEK